MNPAVSGYVPCFNNRATLVAAIQSLQRQTVPVAEVVVVDDGSTDGSGEAARQLGVRVVRLETNLGRGAARARALSEAAHELVISCDATNALAPDFLERAIPWLETGNVAAVFGRMAPPEGGSTLERWRARHLFKAGRQHSVDRRALLACGGTLMRKSNVLAAGNFDAALRHSEDADLGARLLAHGWEVIFDPALNIAALSRNTFFELMERYWRWHAGKDEGVSWHGYARLVAYSLKGMAREDLRAGDPLSVPVSLFAPHYQFWKSWSRRRARREPLT